jgi:hypothetical protein
MQWTGDAWIRRSGTVGYSTKEECERACIEVDG